MSSSLVFEALRLSGAAPSAHRLAEAGKKRKRAPLRLPKAAPPAASSTAAVYAANVAFLKKQKGAKRVSTVLQKLAGKK